MTPARRRTARNENAGLREQTGVRNDREAAEAAEQSDLAFDQFHLQFGDGFRRIESLRAGLGAVHDSVAAIQPERILEIVEALAGAFVAGVVDPPRGLQQRRRAEEAFAVPPV